MCAQEMRRGNRKPTSAIGRRLSTVKQVLLEFSRISICPLCKSRVRYHMYSWSNLTKRGLWRVVKSCRKMSNLKDQKPIENSIRKKLSEALSPHHLDVLNESYMHNVPKGSETHFKVIVISDKFDDQPLIKRHRMVNELLQQELQSGVHALSIVAKTRSQWEESNKTVTSSPACRGGFGR